MSWKYSSINMLFYKTYHCCMSEELRNNPCFYEYKKYLMLYERQVFFYLYLKLMQVFHASLANVYGISQHGKKKHILVLQFRYRRGRIPFNPLTF